MAIKKSELYSSLWKSCDELRGGMDASQYKDYVLTLLFVKYVSDRYAGNKDSIIEVPKGGSFADLIKLKGDKEIGDKTNIVIGKLAAANDLKGVIDAADFNDEDKLGRGQDMIDRLSKLIAIFENHALNFSKNRADGDDILGDAYEYLMRHFATESGKSKGQFYTPAEVSRIIAKLIGANQAKSQSQTIYDPTCGSGSLLIKAAYEAPKGLTIYGQENDNATAALARMNMFLHGHPTAEIWKGNTLSEPHFTDRSGKLKTFDFVVANPPFSTKSWSNGVNITQDPYDRFEYGVPPKKNGDYAFFLHVIRSLKSTGKAAVILPHGVLFRGNSEAHIRKNLIQRGYIKAIIGLPANLFYGTGIPACIVVVDKENAAGRKGIFMIDASKGFIKDGNKNRLREQDIHKIVDIYTKQIELEKFSRLVPVAEIADPTNDYNLNLPRYIDSAEAEDLHDISAHLQGGIPVRDVDALSDYWAAFPSLRAKLFVPNGRKGYMVAKVHTSEVKPTIFTNPEFIAYSKLVRGIFNAWKEKHTGALRALKVGSKPKMLIEHIGEDLLARFADEPLLDRYDVYQQLMNYWAAVMQDDAFAIASEGWEANEDLVPRELIITHYFARQKKEIETLQSNVEELTRQIEELEEEHGGEEGLLFEARNDKDKITKASVKTRLAACEEGGADVAEAGEIEVLEAYLDLSEKGSAANKQVKDAQKALDKLVTKKYADLGENDVKALVVEGKWLAALERDIMSEMERVTQNLANRVRELEERYAVPLPNIQESVATLTAKVEEHLKAMGFAWGGAKKTRGAA